MASRYLLIEFDDEASASRLREQIDTATKSGKRFRVIGLFSKPTPPYCQCKKETTTKTQGSTLKRGRKFGWLVCTVCKRPSSSLSGLVNLIRPRDIIDPQMYDPIYTEWGKDQLMSYPLLLTLLPRKKDAE